MHGAEQAERAAVQAGAADRLRCLLDSSARRPGRCSGPLRAGWPRRRRWPRLERYRGPNGDSGTVDVIAELSRLVAAVTAFRDFTEARLRALTADEWAAHGPRVAAEVRMFETACDQARRVLRDVARLGLAERAQEAEARVSEAMGTRIAGAVAAIVVRLGHPSPLADRATGAICAEELEKLLGSPA